MRVLVLALVLSGLASVAHAQPRRRCPGPKMYFEPMLFHGIELNYPYARTWTVSQSGGVELSRCNVDQTPWGALRIGAMIDAVGYELGGNPWALAPGLTLEVDRVASWGRLGARIAVAAGTGERAPDALLFVGARYRFGTFSAGVDVAHAWNDATNFGPRAQNTVVLAGVGVNGRPGTAATVGTIVWAIVHLYLIS